MLKKIELIKTRLAGYQIFELKWVLKEIFGVSIEEKSE
jgi:hypothetical protein